jgi:hypothetical protein
MEQARVVDLVRMGGDRPHWGLPVRYAPPRYLGVTLTLAVVGLAAIGPGLLRGEVPLAGLFRQVMTIARTVHLVEQYREPPLTPAPAPQAPTSYGSHFKPPPLFAARDVPRPTAGERALQTVTESRQWLSSLPTYEPAPPEYATRAADPDHAARVQQNLMISDAEDIVAQWQRTPDLVDIARVTEAQQLLASICRGSGGSARGPMIREGFAR